MVTYYVDYEGGNDANAGTSFATRWQTLTNGATAARIAPGDEIRVMASPDPTSIGNATWTGGGRPGAFAIASSTNASPIVITMPSAHGLVTGDYVMITGHATNTNANGVWLVGTTPTSTTFQILQINGANTTGNGAGTGGTVTNVDNVMVKTATPLVQNIALCGGRAQKPVWTSAASVTTTQDISNFKEGNSSASIAIQAGFTTGKAAYYTLPSALDLSGYQQVSFWVRQTAGTIGAAGAVYVALCTDTIGDTVVHTCNVPALGVTGVWFPVTVNLGTNLNSAIQSVAFYVVTDNAAQTFLLDNITAGKAASSADSVTLTSLISKSDGTGDEAWYAIQSLNNDAIMLANYNNVTAASNELRGYNGTTETVTTYKRETIKTTPQTSTDAIGLGIINDSGAVGNVIAYSGGWNRTDMSTRTGVTWLDGQNGAGRGMTATTTRSNITVDRLNFCRYYRGLYFFSTSITTLSNMYATANTLSGLDIENTSFRISVTNLWCNNNETGVAINGSYVQIDTPKLVSNNSVVGMFFNNARFVEIGSLIAGNNSNNSGIGNIRYIGAVNVTIQSATINRSEGPAFSLNGANNCFVNGGSSSNNVSGVVAPQASASSLYLNNFTINEATEFSSGIGGGFLYSNRHDNTDNNSWIWQAGMGTINQQTAVVDSPATTAWQMRPTNTTNTTATSPLMLKLGTVVCAASSLVTVTARMRRNNTGLTMRLICPGGQISGVATDVFSDMTAAINTWETVTITFTPTKPGAVNIYAYAFGGATLSGFVSNLTAAQA
jgi:hypothetical protein